MQVGHDSTKSCFSEITILESPPTIWEVFIITYCARDGALTPNSKMEISPVFSILNLLFLSKMEILTLFSSLNKKIWETASRLDKIYFQVTHSSQIFVFCIYKYFKHQTLIIIHLHV